MTTYLVHEARLDGTYRPVLYHGGKPAQRTYEGRKKRWKREPVPVPCFLANAPIDEIERAYTSATIENPKDMR